MQNDNIYECLKIKVKQVIKLKQAKHNALNLSKRINFVEKFQKNK